MEYCIYESTHPSGVFYRGKGKTAQVLAGLYKGSGTTFKAALLHPDFNWDTWTTVVIKTFPSEDLAFAAEEVFVPLSLLTNPLCLNQIQGGKFGRHKDRSAILRSHRATLKRERSEVIKAKRKVKTIQEREKAIKMKARIKELSRG